MLLLSCFSRVRLCATPQMAAQQAPPSLGFSRQEHWSGLPFPSPIPHNQRGGRELVSFPVGALAFRSECQSQGGPSQPGLRDPHRPLGGKRNVREFKKEENVGCTKLSKSKLNPRVGLNNCSLWFVFFIQEGSLGGRQQKGRQSWGAGEAPGPQLAEKTSGLISCTH